MNNVKIINENSGLIALLVDGEDVDDPTPILWDRGAVRAVVGRALGTELDADLERWVKVQLNMSEKYGRIILELAKKGLLKVSAGFLGRTKRLIELALTTGEPLTYSVTPAAATSHFKSLGWETIPERGVTTMPTAIKTSRRDTPFLSKIADDDVLSVTSLARKGYDCDGDGVIRYEGTPIWPDAIRTPTESDDDAVKALRRSVRVSLSPAYSAAFTKFMDLAVRWHNPTAGYSMLAASDKKALAEGLDTGGGYLVPADFGSPMLRRMTATAVVRSRARVIPTGRDTLVLPEFGSSSSTYNSGFTGTWEGESALFTENDPAIGQFQAPVRKLRAGVKLSKDLYDDAGGVSWLTEAGADNLAAAEDLAFLNGVPASLQPQGVLQSGITAIDVEGSTSHTVSNTTAADGSGSKLLTFVGSLPSQYQRNAVLVMAAATEASVNKLVDANRAFLFDRERGADGNRELLGFPVQNSPHMPLEGTAANKVVLAGDFGNGYVIAQRSVITMVLTERFADSDQVGVILINRVGGAVYNVDAFRAGAV